MKRYFLICLTSFSTLFTHTLISKTEGICIVPVADLITQKINSSSTTFIEKFYSSMPSSENPPLTCCRLTQLLFNERVTILKTEHEQVYIQTPFYYSIPPTYKKNNCFWTLKKNIMSLSQLSTQTNAYLPETTASSHQKLIRLKNPFFFELTGLTYSAGTTFVVFKHADGEYQIYIPKYNPDTSVRMYLTAIADNECIEVKKRSLSEKRLLFVTLLREWSHSKNHIPYVLGGASIVDTVTENSFDKKTILDKGSQTISYQRSHLSSSPVTGIDCSGLIRLACSIADIPLHATNSISIKKTLIPLPKGNFPKNGDLLYWKGHIAIISDIDKGLLIEARGYDHHYGIVHECPYAQQLKDIKTTQDLVTAYKKNKPITRLDKKGAARDTITDLMILRLVND